VVISATAAFLKTVKTNNSSLPTTGQVLAFLVKCFGESKSKGVGEPAQLKAGQRKTTNWAHYKRIERLAKQYRQSERVSREIGDALIDAVAALFDKSLRNDPVSRKIRGMSLQARIPSLLHPLRDANAIAPRPALRLLFWIVYFIEHHEWLRPQLEAAHAPNEALWQWVQHTSHFYTNTLLGSVATNRRLFAGLPGDLSWNVPSRQANGTVKWPICQAIEWWENLLDARHKKNWPSLVNPCLSLPDASRCVLRWKRGTNPPGLETVKRWTSYPWQYNDFRASLNPEKLKAVLLWCRALQFALKAVEKRFGLDSVWVLVAWHKRAVSSRPVTMTDGDRLTRS
jgi:hypothetical protein